MSPEVVWMKEWRRRRGLLYQLGPLVEWFGSLWSDKRMQRVVWGGAGIGLGYLMLRRLGKLK